MKRIYILTGFCITLLFISSCSKQVVSEVKPTQVTQKVTKIVSNTITPTVATYQGFTVSPAPSAIEITSPPDSVSDNTIIYSNPIDEYFIPRINDKTKCEVEKREYQDTYRGVWKAEFENNMNWMYSKCAYQVDKDNLATYEQSIRQLFDSTRAVVVTGWSDTYKIPTNERYPGTIWGTGTRSALNQIEAEIYRDAGLRLIDDTYIFLKKDYSKEHYE